MAKGPPPPWARRDCRFDHLVAAAIGQGHGTTVIYKGLASLERADDVRRGIYRCAKHRGVSADAGPAGTLVTDPQLMGIRKTGKTFELRFRVWPKTTARKRHLARYGPDRQKWPYNPRRAATQAERAAWRPRDETGKPAGRTP